MTDFYTNVFLRGGKVYRRGYFDGRPYKDVVEYEPYLFIPALGGEYRTLDRTPLKKIKFAGVRDARGYLEEKAGVENSKVYGSTNFQYTFIYDNYPGEIQYDPSLVSVVSIDIETPTDKGFPDPQTASTPISNITVSKDGKIVVFGCEYYKPKSESVRYVLCEDEADLLNKFLMLWNHRDWMPDIVTGWNIEHFDIPYIVNRIGQVLGEGEVKKLSPWGIVKEQQIIRGKSAQRAGKQIEDRFDTVYQIFGISSLDYLELYKKFSFTNQESYRLDYIAQVELGEKKLDYSEHSSLYEFYKRDYEKFVDYNIHDVVLVDKLDDKLKLIDQVMAFAYDAKVNYSDTMTTVRSWDVIIHNYLLDKKIAIPQADKDNDLQDLVGGYVKDPKLGMSDWVVSFDLNSLYPHLIMQYNISPETFVDKVGFPSIDYMLEGNWEYRDGSVAYAANGCTYRKDKQGFLPALMEKMYDDRVAYKKQMLEAKKKYEETKDPQLIKEIARCHNMQLAKKIQLNSAYGALGNKYFRWFSFDNAEAITTSGQLSIRWIEKKINEFFNKLLKTEGQDYVIASDTDSIYVEMGPLVKKVLGGKTDREITLALDSFVEAKVQPYIDRCYQELADTMNAYQQKMQMKRETIANKGIWKAKKMYILNAWNVEGVQYDKPKLKIQGIEAVRSSTPYACREKLKRSFEIVMNEDVASLRKFVDDFRDEFNGLPFEEVSFPRSVKFTWKSDDNKRGRYELGDKSLPIQVRGALRYNEEIRARGLDKKYPMIQEGDKIKFAYLKMPNPLHENVIASPDVLPEEFELDKYIDRETQFNKTFFEPLRSITDVIEWNLENYATLEDFFS
jgi:DNA polymerase elongation subunit (family B)